MEREQALEAAVSQIERQFGKGAIMKMGEASHVDIDSVSTGALSLDLGLGIGGLPRGRVVEVFGPESSGKTTLCYHVIAEAQRKGGLAAFIDAEHAMDPTYARRIGVNVDELLLSQPDNGEQALEIAEMLIRSGALDVLVIDSVAALVPRAEIEGEMGDSHVGLQARLMSQALRKIAGTLNRTGTICIFTNQLREKIGVMFGCFHYSTRVVLEDGSTEKIGKIVSQRMPVRVMSMDPETGRISPKRIAEYYNNGRADEFIQFEVAAGGGSGIRRFACTPNHIIFTPDGEVAADELEVGDEVLVAMTEPALAEARVKELACAGGGRSPYPIDAPSDLGSDSGLRPAPMRILRKYTKPTTRMMDRYDLQIEDNHTYLADHVVVHNSPETTPGGRALKFYSSVRLDIRRIETLKEGTEAVGNRVRVKIVKNKVAPPFKQAEFDIAYGEGISWEGSVLDVALERKIVTKSGSFFSFGDERLGQGRTNVKAFLVEHPDVTSRILDQIQEQLPEVVVPRRDMQADAERERTVIPANGASEEEAAKNGAAKAPAAAD
jgi:protein RecA